MKRCPVENIVYGSGGRVRLCSSRWCDRGLSLLLELLSGPSPNDFWFNLSKISHNDTSLFMFICLSKMMPQCANGCLCWRTILPRVSVPRGDRCHDGGHDENIGVNQFALSILHSWEALAVGGLWAQLCCFRLLSLYRKFWFRVSAEATFIKSET